MRTRILGCTLVALGVLSGVPEVAAQTLPPPGTDMTCLDYDLHYNFVPPECDFQGNSVMGRRLLNVCGSDGAPGSLPVIDVDVSYPDPALLTPGTRFAPVVLAHGGGVAPAYKDIHPAGHGTNPYQNLAWQLVFKGMIVIQPIDPNLGPNGNPFDEQRCGGTAGGAVCTSNADCVSPATCQVYVKGIAHRLVDAITCVTRRFDGTIGPTGAPRCSTEPQGCVNDLVNKVAWTEANRESLVFIGHSAGGIAGLYFPAMYGSALKGLLLIDPAKDSLTANPPASISTNTPVVHFYPDWYGPMAKSEPNTTIQLGTASSTITGPWVPIGIRDYPGCNPDTGCHEANHCSGLGNHNAYLYHSGEHAPWCGSGFQYCAGGSYDGLACPTGYCPGGTCTLCTKVDPTCPSGTTCGQHAKCIKGPTKPTAATWTLHRNPGGEGTTASSILRRYVLAYAGCLGGFSGAKWQPWVTGRQRDLDDSGAVAPDGDTTACLDSSAAPSMACSMYSTWSSCTLNGCYWSRGTDGAVIRKNNGQLGISAYGPGTSSDPRYGYGPTTAVINQPAWPGWNPVTGAFDEVSERLDTTPGGAKYIACQSGPGFVP